MNPLTYRPNRMTDAEARQIAVEDLDHHIFLSAGAGAGKTRVLVDRYLHILRQQRAEADEIVAVTFTEKAANEMRERLRQELSRFPSPIPHAVRHLRALENAPISTIHALCARLLREHAVAAGIDPQFAVLDEVDATLLLEETMEDFVRSRLRASDGATMLTLVREWGLSKTTSLLCDFVDDRERALSSLEAMPSEQGQLLALWRKAIEGEQKAALHALLSDARWTESLDVLRRTLPRDDSDPAAVHRAYVLNCAVRVTDESLPIAERVQVVCEMPTHIKSHAGQQKNWHSKDDLAAVREALKRLRSLCEEFAKQRGSENNTGLDERAAEVSLAFAAELRRALEAYDRAKRERSVLDFADLQLRARDLLRQHPDVRQQYQQRFKFIMVDEFQDTNALQKEIVWLLAGKRMRDEEPTSEVRPSSRLFIAGDIKQGIYRFRGADVAVFNATREEFKGDPECRVLELSKNFRTQSSLVDFFNRVFSHPAVMGGSEGKALYEAAYTPMEAHRADEAPTTCRQPVEFLLVRKTDEEDERNAADLRRAEAHAIAQRITELVNDGARYGDIALLFSAMTDVAIYENALRAHHIPYYIVAGSGLYRQQEVKDVLNFLSVLENVHDDIALIGVLRSPFFAVSDETLYWLCHPPRECSLYERMVDGQWFMANEPPLNSQASTLNPIPMRERDKLRRAVQLLTALREVKNRLRLSQLINLVLERTGFTAVLLTQFMGEQKVSNVRKLVDIARAFERKGNFTLQDFIAHLAEFVSVEQRESEAATQEEESNVVKLLTVHRAKGLEWSIVFVPDLARARRGGGGVVLMHPTWGFVAPVEDDAGKPTLPSIGHVMRREENCREVAEHRRLLYVAVTRARDRLILSSAFRLEKKTWLQWLNDALGGLEEIGKLGHWDMSGQVEVRWFDRPVEGRSQLSDALPRPASCGQHIGTLLVDEEQLRRQVQPVPVRFGRKSCFSIAELCDYLWCPQKYFLAHGRQLPATGQCINGSIGQWAYAELLRKAVGLLCRRHSEDAESIVRTCLRQTAIVGDGALVEHLHQVLRRFLQSDLWRKFSGMNLQSHVQVQWTLDEAQVAGVIDLLGTEGDGLLHLAQLKAVSPCHPLEATMHRFEIGLLCEAARALLEQGVESATIYYFEDGREEVVPPVPPRLTAAETITCIRQGEFDRRADAPCSACDRNWACALRLTP